MKANINNIKSGEGILSLTAIISILAIVGLIAASALQASDHEDGVSATVSIGDVSVTIDPTSFDYGSLPFNTEKESFDSSLNSNNISATVGGVTTDLDIRGDDTDPTSGDPWTLNNSTNGADQYMHRFATATGETNRPEGYTALTDDFANNELAAGVAAEGVVWFGLEIQVPSSGNDAEQTAPVTVRATFADAE